MSSVLTRARGWRPSRRLLVIVAVLVVAVAAVAVALVATRPADVATRTQFIEATPEDGRAVELDTTLFLPSSTPAPAVLLAHGFGGSKNSETSAAEDLARHGYVVLTYSARGFGASGGAIHLDAPDYEVADARRLVDFLASRPEVRKDAPGDPRVGVAGGSYGGALALLLAGTDRRVDAVAADITWNDLQQALAPNGVFKKQWAGYLFQGGFAAGGAPGADSAAGGAAALSRAVSCGRFAADVCAAYQDLASTGEVSDSTAALLRASSPETVAGSITAPTLLTQGEDDSLFPLSQVDANARAIAGAGTDVRVVWRQGGHDSPGTGNDVVTSTREQWFDEHLRGEGTSTRSFQLARGGPRVSAATQTTDWVGQTYRVDGGYPGIDGHRSDQLDVTLPTTPQPIAAPAGGVPAAVSSLPGVGGLLSVAGGAGALPAIPGQTAVFLSEPLPDATLIAGAPTMSLRITPATTTDATLFLALRDVDPSGGGLFGGGETLPANLVAPVRLDRLTPGQPTTVQVQLPTIAYQVPAGHRVAVTVSTTDQAYGMPTDARTYLVAVAGDVRVPTVTATAIASSVSWTPWIVALLVVLVVAAFGAAAWWRRRRAHVAGLDERLSDVPVAVQDLVKTYKDGYRAVDGVSFVVERGQVVGLLGPNGAGKTTALRVLMGLMRPTSGSVRVFGEPVLPGAAVLSRLGSFVEGSGFMPHLSGEDNLRLYWAATGRPDDDARFDVAAQIAGLGSSIDRKVKTYSQGMRQRLAIAQAMLGLPEVLVLDEPTNGLDPPQIAEMREVLRRYAETGRTVLLSSHLLAEVEQTCTHVVVMHRGRVVAAGTVADVAGQGGTQLAVDDATRAAEVLQAAGIAATAVPARRALEDVFLELIDDGGDGR
ncbi:alpha/beta fold hydrolase [Jatrophihabitans sp. YIM 134969]